MNQYFETALLLKLRIALHVQCQGLTPFVFCCCTEVARQLKISPTAVSRAAAVGRKLPDRREIQKQFFDI